jgi:uncharacterized protein (TIGR02145 family)
MGTVLDIDGNSYNTVVIGTQEWTTSNLVTTKYNDGTSITNITDGDEWKNLETEAYAWFNNDETTYKSICGAFYNWYAINTGKLAPIGWHVPTKEDFNTLISYVGENCGNKLKTIGTTYWSSDSGATDLYGFGARGTGYRHYQGNFTGLNFYGYHWSSTPSEEPNYPWSLSFFHSNPIALLVDLNAVNGFCVRCIKNVLVANFSGTPTTGKKPLNVQFTDSSDYI